jgi:hypothetical protein
MRAHPRPSSGAIVLAPTSRPKSVGPVECHVTGRPDGRDRESQPAGESPRWP